MRAVVDFRLMMITDSESEVNGYLKKKVTEACRLGVKAIQFRDKKSNTRRLLRKAKELRKITSGYSVKLIINDRADITLISNADGLHLPSYDLDVKSLLRFDLLMGKSTHSLKEARKANTDGFDYILFGPVFETESKLKYGKPQGLKKLKTICKEVDIPVFAVGGITPERALLCLQNGAYGVAVIGAISHSKNIKNTISEFRKYLGTL
jgi:thiamine-phosphate pyrophosphorylase